MLAMANGETNMISFATLAMGECSGGLDFEPTFHCFKQGETCCYVFCDGKVFSQDEKYIFESNNDNSDMVSFANIP